jgi:SAM-dependent methyltransferase
MIKEYIYLRNLSSSQNEQIKNFNNNSKIHFEKLINCEICRSEKISILFNNDRYGINQKTSLCNECGFMFSNPRMTSISAEYFYNSDLYRLIYNAKNLDEDTMFKNTLMELREYKPSIPKKPEFNHFYPNLYFDFINSEIKDFETVLDIGCGPGKKIIDFNFIGKKTYGIEPSKTYHKVHSELGLNAKVGFIKDVTENYDLVTLTHVFEHLTDLEKNINHLHNITKKYLFIEVPGHVKKLQSIQNAHNYYFSINTLNHFFLNNKFELIKIDYARDNEFIYALYKKTEEKSDIMFDKTLELRIIRNIIRKYFFKYICIKILKLFRIENNVRKFYTKLTKII